MTPDPFPEDPYESVLGIPPGVRPPNHYDLIRAQLFEGNIQTLANMADAQIIRLRKSKIDHETMNQLYYELCLARGVLTNAGTKAGYDRQLRVDLGHSAQLPTDEGALSHIDDYPFVPPILPPKKPRGSPVGAIFVNLAIAAAAMMYFQPFGERKVEPEKPVAGKPTRASAAAARGRQRHVAAEAKSRAEAASPQRDPVAGPVPPADTVVPAPASAADDGIAVDVTRDATAVSKYWRESRSGAPFRFDPEQRAVFADRASSLGRVVYPGPWAEIEFEIQAPELPGHAFSVSINGATLELGSVIKGGAQWQPVRICFDLRSSELSATVGRSEPVGGTVTGVSAAAFVSRCDIRLGESSGVSPVAIAVRNMWILKVPRGETMNSQADRHGVADGENRATIPKNGVAAGSPHQVQSRQPVPDRTAQDEATSVIMEVHKADFSRAQTQLQKVELAKMLLQEGIETTGDLNGRYVLLRMAVTLATENGDVHVVLGAIDAIASAYNVDSYDTSVEALTKLAKTTISVSGRKELVDVIEQKTNWAAKDDRYTAAQQLAALAVAVSRSTKDAVLLKRLVARGKEIDQTAAQFAEAQEALKVLDEKSEDPDANLVVGRFRCFHKQDWKGGLPLLAHSNDETLKALAQKEAAGPDNANEQAELGDGWWAFGEKETGASTDNVRRRAAVWYRKALPELSGLSKAKVEKRLAEIEVIPAQDKAPSAKVIHDKPSEKPSSVRWREHNSLRTEKAFNEEWNVGRYEFGARGLRLLNEVPVTSKFQTLDKTKIVITFVHTGRDLDATWCGKNIRVKCSGTVTCVLVFQRHGNKLAYSLVGNGELRDSDTIRLSDTEATAPSRLTIRPVVVNAIPDGEVTLQSVIVTGPVVWPN